MPDRVFDLPRHIVGKNWLKSVMAGSFMWPLLYLLHPIPTHSHADIPGSLGDYFLLSVVSVLTSFVLSIPALVAFLAGNFLFNNLKLSLKHHWLLHNAWNLLIAVVAWFLLRDAILEDLDRDWLDWIVPSYAGCGLLIWNKTYYDLSKHQHAA